MIWATRRFSFGAYGPYQDLMWDLHFKLPHLQEWMMVSSPTKSVGIDDVFVALPDQTFLHMFEGFVVINEDDTLELWDLSRLDQSEK